MKGVSSVIAIILILMIVIALAALAYTWFSGIFASLTSTAGSAVQTTTGAMATQFSIEAVKQAGTAISFVIRNTGTTNIDLTNTNAYTGDGTLLGDTISGTLNAGQRSAQLSAGSTGTPAPGCASCSGGVCYYPSGKIQTLRVTIGTGLENSATVTC
jgi:flagellin-like protein